MQAIATEMNISETAFIQRLSSGDTFEKSKQLTLVFVFFMLTNEELFLIIYTGRTLIDQAVSNNTW